MGSSGIATDQVHTVFFTGRIHPLIKIFNSFHAESVAEADAKGYLCGQCVHGIDVAEVDHHRLVSKVFEWRIGQIKMYTLNQQVCCDNRLFAEVIDHRCIITHAQH